MATEAQRQVAVTQEPGSRGHPPPGEVGQRGLADQAGETAGEGGAGQPGHRVEAPGDHHEVTAKAMLDELIGWAETLKTLRV